MNNSSDEITISIPLKFDGRYNFKSQTERLIYLGRYRGWHQFSKVESPEIVWSEISDKDLWMIEETKE